MFGILYENEDGRFFKIYSDLPSAQNAANNMVCGLGWKATIYDYDTESAVFCEFYPV